MRVVVGLGNPGPRYASTRHNLGFMIVDRLARRWHIQWSAQKRELRSGAGRVVDQMTMLIQPQLYMNMSGSALKVVPELRVEDLIVVHDDIDLPAGRLRLRRDGGTGGHRGIASIVGLFGPDFDRVRVGIGRPPDDVEVPDFVLQPMSTEELQDFEESIEQACDAVELIVTEGIDQAMNRFNARPLSPVASSSGKEM